MSSRIRPLGLSGANVRSTMFSPAGGGARTGSPGLGKQWLCVNLSLDELIVTCQS